MYRTAFDMQWINSKLDIDITKQKEISYIKRLKSISHQKINLVFYNLNKHARNIEQCDS